MKQFIRGGWLRARAGAPIAIGYIILALVLGFNGDLLGAHLFADEVSPISSASAIAILSAVASGMMALTAIVFSLVVVAVQHASAAYSPRLVRVLGASFTAHALGVFSGTFVYALLAIRTVDIAGGVGINTSIVGVAFVWLLASVAFLVRLLPRIRGFTISDVLVALGRRATSVAVRVYPTEEVTSESPAGQPPEHPVTQTLLHEYRPMYLVGLDLERLVRSAAEADAVIVVPLAIGDAVIAGDRLATVLGAKRPIPDRAVRDAIWLADDRQVDNDPSYAIRLLVDIAIRALSPAINDPTTAVSVLDELDGLLRVLGRRCLEENQVTDERGVVRVVRAVPTWDDLLALALTEIHQYGRESLQVERRLAMLIRDLPEVLPPQRHGAIERFGRWRVQTLANVIRDAQGWLDPLTIDRQGIGHEGNGSPHP
jgi:uncharacterized membrane protein